MANLLVEAHDFINGSCTNPSFNPMCIHHGELVFHAYCYFTASCSINSCTKIFTRHPSEQSIWQSQLQEAALQRWHQWLPGVDISLREDGLDLQFLFDLFDDYFFQGGTKHNTTVEWLEYLPDLHIYGQTRFQDTGAVISIMRLQPQRVWTRQSVKRLLSTLLHEMAHVFVQLKGCNCLTCLCPLNASNIRGASGHGPSWVKLCEAIEAEANRVLQGLHGIWDLDCKKHGLSLQLERNARWEELLTFFILTLDTQ